MVRLAITGSITTFLVAAANHRKHLTSPGGPLGLSTRPRRLMAPLTEPSSSGVEAPSYGHRTSL
ncbi:hypothetical protein C8Q70DRAFT_581380 [Cubamyces menziesii]|nr:hypothetical protein C8Q70DRAFT_581380 [Cubamyces menziesii]